MVGHHPNHSLQHMALTPQHFQRASLACGAAMLSLEAVGELLPTVSFQNSLQPEIFHKTALIECGDIVSRLEKTRRRRHEEEEASFCPFASLDEASGGRLQQYRSQCPNWAPRMRSHAAPREASSKAVIAAAAAAIVPLSEYEVGEIVRLASRG